MRGDGLEKSINFIMGDVQQSINGRRKQRGRGRPEKRWMDVVREMTGLPLYKLRKETRDREMWRRRRIIAVARGRSRLDGTE